MARSPSPAAPTPPAEPANDGWAAALLAGMLFLAPAVGVPGEEMLQDTLKSIVVSFCALVAALVFLLAQRGQAKAVRWHAVVWLPLLLMAYALGSMAWSHPYLGGVEAVRWFVFALIAWLALNVFSRERLPLLAWCVHLGAVAASVWTVIQFWTGASPFPQGPPPSSTFINRNFFAEFVVCALPFGGLLLARARRSSAIALLSASIGFVVVALLMTGTRSALLAFWMELLVVVPPIAWRCRGQLAWSRWGRGTALLPIVVLLGTVAGLGSIPSGDPRIVAEGKGAAPLLRGFNRTQSIQAGDESVGLRLLMWKDTVRAVAAHPLAGLGAGAWESEIPLYQAEGAQLETDYYVHNEPLQLVAEYGLAGWIFFLLLAAWLLHAAWRTWSADGAPAEAERPWRAVLLASLFALMVVSNAGFPWRLATTGALFALCLGALAASDARLGYAGRWQARALRWSGRRSGIALAGCAACMALALFIAQRAAESERKLVTAAKIALAITASGNPQHPRFDAAKRHILQLTREGIAINPHYRKITPLIADELARWGDWPDATAIWESVLRSRPYVVAIITNAARGYSMMGRNDVAMAYLERARSLQPRAPTVLSLEVALLARSGQPQLAMQKAREALDAGIADEDLVHSYFLLARQARDYPLAADLLQRRVRQWPDSRPRSYLQLGALYANELQDPARALEAYRQAVASAAPRERRAVLQQVPPAYRAQLGAVAP
ncbi:MAG TPA: O-antigen ligase family protein [Ramlibacter sp.]|uniref:O-antigen ligase family protein n=1 Tax=Ramlibacter sp. TaxID=1917967 RepID=UPI002ED441FB